MCIFQTYADKVLVALNPFRSIVGLFGIEVMKNYAGDGLLHEMPSHVYAIGKKCPH